jgi:hypothetical protein
LYEIGCARSTPTSGTVYGRPTPLLVGTFASYPATAWWDFNLAPESVDGVVVDQQFFASIS